MLKIPVPDSANATTKVSLAGTTYDFKFEYFEPPGVQGAYYLTILLNGVIIISGLKLLENVALLKKYDIPEFDHGELIVLKLKDTTDPVGRNNIGFGKPYELIYISDNEL